MHSLFQDLRYALRNLLRNPGFTLTALAALALGIGANTAVFTVVESVLLRPLPYHEPGRLFSLRPMPKKPSPFEFGTMPDPVFLMLQAGAKTFAQLAAYDFQNWNGTGLGDPLSIHGQEVTANFFTALGVQPRPGRGFRTGETKVVVLSEAFWRKHFQGEASALGKTITLDGELHTVIGVMPAGFDPATEMWVPMQLDPHGHNAFRNGFGRLADGVTPARAKAELDAMLAPLPRGAEMEIVIAPLRDSLVGDARPALLIFLGAVGFVLLIACVNVANLLLSRASARRREIAIRVSLGAGRGRLVRQLLTESAAIGIIGGLAGMLVAAWGVAALIQFAPANRIPRLDEIRFDGWVLVFNIGVSLITSLLFGLAPALHLSRPPARYNRTGALRSALMMAQVALALVLLIGAGLLIRSFAKLRAVNLGFHPDNVIAMNVELTGQRYEKPDPIRQFDGQVLARIAQLPGVTAAGLVNWLPMSNALIQGDFKLKDQQAPPDVIAAKPAVSPDYFRAMGIPIVRGRAFDAHDTPQSEAVVIVDERFAHRFWPNENPIGKGISYEDHPTGADWMTVVGVAHAIRQQNPASQLPTIYQPLAQVRQSFFLQEVSFVVRANRPVADLAPALRAQVWGVDKDLPIHAMNSMRELWDASTAEPRFQTRVLGSFSTIAFLLAVVGIYGVMAYAVAQRTQEIGIRMAIGAEKRHIVRMILWRGAVLVTGGLALGLAGAWAVTRVLKNFLFEVTPVDPITFAAVSLALAAIALCACYIPARRAAAVDPLVALRYE